MKTIRYERVAHPFGVVGVVTFDEPESSVNTMCVDWQADMSTLSQQMADDAADSALGVCGFLLTSAKSTFFAGADLKGVMRMTESDAPRAYQEIELLKRNMRRIETLGKPVVSCINGTALGGGWEVALIGHHRIAVDDSKIQLGLPEVGLGLLPGASGVTKMTRALGILAAQPYLMEGKLFGPKQALDLGLIHALAADAQALTNQALVWLEANQANPQAATHPWEAREYRIPGGKPTSPSIAMGLAVAPAMLRKRTWGLMPAPEAIMACMIEGASVDVETALRIESRYLAKLMTGSNARAMINTFFFNLNAVKSGASRPKGVPRYKPQKVGLLGAGMMGAGIAYAQASRGIETVLKDTSLEKAQAGKAYSEKLTTPRVSKGRMTVGEQQTLLARIKPTADAADLAGCDLIIEAVFENRALKAQVTADAEPMLAPGGFFASNTSTLPISGLAQASAHAAKFVGIHFFSPVDKMKLVEIIRGRETDDETLARAYDYVLALGKLPIVVNDSRGFFTSRTFGTFVMEAVAMLGEGVPAEIIENACVQAGMPVGGLAVLDETSLTLSMHVRAQARADLAEQGQTYVDTPGELLVARMVNELGRGGRAAGGGFYEYPEGGKKRLWSGLKQAFPAKTGFEAPAAFAELKDRILYRQAVEAIRCLHEGVLTTVHDANIGSIFGIGFPAWTGGALQFVYGMGVPVFAARAAQLARDHGAGFALSDEAIACVHAHRVSY